MGTKLDKPPLQAAGLLAYCCLSDNPYSRVVVTAILLNGGVHHVALKWSQELVLLVKAMIAEDEAERASQRHQIHKVSRFLGNVGIRVHSIPGGVEIDSRDVKEVTEADIERMIKNDPAIEVSRTKKPAD